MKREEKERALCKVHFYLYKQPEYTIFSENITILKKLRENNNIVSFFFFSKSNSKFESYVKEQGRWLFYA